MRYQVKSKMIGQLEIVEAKNEKDAINKAARKMFGMKENQEVNENMIASFEIKEIK